MMNTYAWINATKISSKDIKMENSTEMMVIDVLNTAPNDAVIKMMDTSERIMA